MRTELIRIFFGFASPKATKLITRLCLDLSHHRGHQFKYNFQDCGSLFALADMKLKWLLTPTSFSQQRKQKDDPVRHNVEHQSKTIPFQAKVFSSQIHTLMIIQIPLS